MISIIVCFDDDKQRSSEQNDIFQSHNWRKFEAEKNEKKNLDYISNIRQAVRWFETLGNIHCIIMLQLIIFNTSYSHLFCSFIAC